MRIINYKRGKVMDKKIGHYEVRDKLVDYINGTPLHEIDVGRLREIMKGVRENGD